jgi:hypothetical protein
MRAVYAWLRRDGLPGSPQLSGRLIPTGKTSDVFFTLVIGAILIASFTTAWPGRRGRLTTQRGASTIDARQHVSALVVDHGWAKR